MNVYARVQAPVHIFKRASKGRRFELMYYVKHRFDCAQSGFRQFVKARNISEIARNSAERETCAHEARLEHASSARKSNAR